MEIKEVYIFGIDDNQNHIEKTQMHRVNNPGWCGWDFLLQKIQGGGFQDVIKISTVILPACILPIVF